MRGLVRHAANLLLAGVATTLGAATPLAELSLSALEQRLREIAAQLAKLANYNPSGGVGAIGSRSRGYDTAEQEEWIEIDLGDAVPLDQVLLVPAIRRDRGAAGLRGNRVVCAGTQCRAAPTRFRQLQGRRSRPRPLEPDGWSQFLRHDLSTRVWLNQLALRHELERERPLVSAELNQRYSRQKSIQNHANLLALRLNWRPKRAA
jgi:hypothetical protein